MTERERRTVEEDDTRCKTLNLNIIKMRDMRKSCLAKKEGLVEAKRRER